MPTALAVRATWSGLTIAFEFPLGLPVMPLRWERLAGDCDLSRGDLHGLTLVAMHLAPWFAARGRKMV